MGSSTVSASAGKRGKWIPKTAYTQQSQPTAYVDYTPYGACKRIFSLKDPELIISGPAGTGKSRGALEKCNWMLEKYPGIRGMMVRKTRRSMTQSCIVTFEQEVNPRYITLDDGRIVQNPNAVHLHGGNQEYRYPNNSIFAVAGIDDPTKIYSSQWDFIYVNQAEELSEEEWEQIRSRIRNNKMPYQQLLGDVNPADPQHWIRRRAATGVLNLVESRHEDNPVYWDQNKQEWTDKGRSYVLGTLEALTGVRKKRLRYGQWAAAEGTVYEDSWDRSHHIIDRFVDLPLDKDQVPKDWRRFWSIDFGYKNPFVWQAWAQDHDGRLFRYKEIYHTGIIVEDHAKKILEITKDEPKPVAIICDHDAEDRATLQKHLGMSTIAAWKSVSPGIQAVEHRLRKDELGKASIFYLRDSVIQIDPSLLAKKQPTCTEDEYEVYVWETSMNRRRGEEPKKEYDHGQDDTRYLVAYVDEISKFTPKMFNMISLTKSGGGGSGGAGSLTQGSSYRMGTRAPSKFGRSR